MRLRRASRWTTRTIAALATIFIATSGVGAALYPHTAAARECCKTHCDHGAQSGMKGCCCDGVPASPVASPNVPDPTPAVFAVLAGGVAPVVRHTGVPFLHHAPAPPGTPGFLERCTLLL